MIGKEIRLRQLFKYTNKLFILPMDHGITIGPVKGLTDIPVLVDSVKDYIDGVVVHKGLVSQIADVLGQNGCNLIVHLSASTSLAPDPNKKELVTSVAQAIRMGATAASVHINLGSSSEVDMLKGFGAIADTCESWGLPLIAMMYVRDGSKDSEFDAVKIKHAARVAEELGADIVKVNYTGNAESFYEVVNAVRIPVIIAGGQKMSNDLELLKIVYDAMQAGAAGVAIGRNIFQHQHPAPLASAIRQIMDAKVQEDELVKLVEACSIIV